MSRLRRRELESRLMPALVERDGGVSCLILAPRHLRALVHTSALALLLPNLLPFTPGLQWPLSMPLRRYSVQTYALYRQHVMKVLRFLWDHRVPQISEMPSELSSPPQCPNLQGASRCRSGENLIMEMSLLYSKQSLTRMKASF